jgi:antitoxin MazE
MSTRIKTRIIKIGNSHGIRIPKPLLEQSGLGEEVELAVQQDQIVIRPSRRPREGWEEQCRLMAARGDDQLLDGDIPGLSSWDAEEWEW